MQTAQRHVDLIGAEAITEEGKRAFDAGDYRWAAQVLHHLVFAQPDNRAARHLQADAYEQMGYQIEGPQWRRGQHMPARLAASGSVDKCPLSGSGCIGRGEVEVCKLWP
jgi:alkyl sulfatase BDS1-like metallo-beta-lactamase superfamily hydrolase